MTEDEETRAAKALADDPEVRDLYTLYVGLGLDEAEARRMAAFDVEMGQRYFPGEDAQTRRQKTVETIQRYWLGEPGTGDEHAR